MKVENREFMEKGIGQNYADLFLRVLKNSPLKAMTIGEMGEMAGLIKRIEKEKEGKTLDLEPSEIHKIKDRANNFPWAIFSMELVEMDAYLKSLA